MTPSPAPDLLGAIRWLYRYHAWARPRLLRAARAATPEQLRQPDAVAGGNGGGSLYGTVVHLVSTEGLWTARWRGEMRPRRLGPDELPDLDAIERHWAAAERDRAAYLEGLDRAALDTPVRYVSGISGREEEQPRWETLLHVSNHVTHHRAEACAALTGLGVPIESVDLLDFMRAGGTPD